MTVISNRTLIFFAALLLLATSYWAVANDESVILLLPAGLLASLYFLQYPALLFYVLLASIPWSFEYNFNATLGTDLPDEPLMLLLAFTTIALALYKKETLQQRWHALLFILCAGMAWLVITVIFSTHFLFSLKYLFAKCWYLLAFVAAPLLIKPGEKLVKKSALVLLVSMMIVTTVALLKHAQLGFTFAKVNDALKPFFRNHVNYSALLVLMLPLQLACYRLTKKVWLRYALVVLLIITVAALYLSYARGAWLAAIVGLMAYPLLKRGWLLKGFLISIVMVAVFTFWLQHDNRYLNFAPDHNTTVFHQNFSEHLAATYKGKDVSTAERFYRWVAGAQMSKENLLTGFGPTTFYQHYKSYTVPAFRTWVSGNKEQSTVHNYFLLLLIEQGLVGLLFFIVLIAAMLWYAQVIYRRSTNKFWQVAVVAMAAIIYMQCTVNFLSDLVETDKVGSIFYLCIAFLIIADKRTKDEVISIQAKGSDTTNADSITATG